MGACTTGLLNNNVTVLDIFNYVKENICKDAEVEQFTDNFYQIYFMEKETSNKRALSFHQCNRDYVEETGYKDGLVLVDLGKGGCSFEVIDSIVKYFGGWYIEDDNEPNQLVFYEFNLEASNLSDIDRELLERLKDEKDWKVKMKTISFIKNNLDFIKSL